MRKYTIEEAEKIIRNLVIEKLKFDEESRKDDERIREKWKDISFFDFTDEQRKEHDNDHNEHNKKYFPSIAKDENGNFIKDKDREKTPQEKLWDFTKYNIPVSENKKCCKNCAVCLCQLADMAPNYLYYCKDWRPRFEIDTPIFYIRPVWKDENYKEPTYEEIVEKEVKDYLEDFKKLEGQAKKLEKGIKGDTKPIPEEIIKKYEEKLEYQKQRREEYEECYDKEETTLFGELKGWTFKPNKEKMKAWSEKYNTCPMGMMVEDTGFSTIFKTKKRKRKNENR